MMSKISNWFDTVIPDAQAVFRRFPLAILLVAAFTFVIIARENFAYISNEMMMQLVGGIILAAYVSVILTFRGEGRGKPVSPIVKAVAVLVSLGLGYFFRELAFIVPAAIGACILFLGNAPFRRRERDDVAVWDFTHKLWTAVLFTVAGSIIYVMGVFAISGALKSLFDVSITNIVEDWLLPIGLGFLAPMAWMSMLPRHDDNDDGDSLRNPGFISKAVGFLGAWILAPLTLIYAVILLAYGVKIMMTQTVPDGEIAELVTPFLIVGALTWLILDPPFIQKKRLARLYTKLWFPLSIPAALLLAYAVFVRIGHYGWTIERYLLVLASVWALGIACWFTFRGEAKRDIRIISSFAALLLALGSIGPWGADAVSNYSQGKRLKSALVANQMLNADGYLKPVTELNLADNHQAIRAKGALNYLVKHKKGRQILKFVPDAEKADIRDNMTKGNNWEYSYVSKRFGVGKVKTPSRYSNSEQNGGISKFEYSSNLEAIPVTGFDLISTRKIFRYNGNSSDTETFYKLGKYRFMTKGKYIYVKDMAGQELGKFDVIDWVKKQPINQVNDSINLVPRIILFEDNDIRIAVHITYVEYWEVRRYTKIHYLYLVKDGNVDEN